MDFPTTFTPRHPDRIVHLKAAFPPQGQTKPEVIWKKTCDEWLVKWENHHF
jgi:hypothetical protein